MRLVTISDIHIRSINDDGYQCLQHFFDHPLTQSATHIGLLGDIFDLMAGHHSAYLKRWKPFFDRIQSFCEQGRTVYLAEGNHDMHLTRLCKQAAKKWSKEAAERFIVLPHDLIIMVGDKCVQLGHGDEYNREDITYLKYKAFIKQPWLSIIANYFMPLAFLDYAGEKASKKSRSYGVKRFNEENIREKFRIGVKQMTPPHVDIVLGGHSHVLDSWEFNEKLYLNNGFPPKSDKFIVVDDSGARLESLTGNKVK